MLNNFLNYIINFKFCLIRSILLLILICKQVRMEHEISDDWKSKSFLEMGCPPVKCEEEHKLYSAYGNFTFEPKYFVIDASLQPEGNKFITLENITDIDFRFYKNKYPDYPNYRFNVNSRAIERCYNSSFTTCVSLEECQIALIPVDDILVLSKKAIFITWRLVQRHITLLFQYKERIVKCVDYDALEIQKIVLQGTQQQNGSATNRTYEWTNKTKEAFKEISNLKSNGSVSVYVSHCFDCLFEMVLESCPDIQKNEKYKRRNVTFSNNVIFAGWQEVILMAPPKINPTCQLKIKPKFLNEVNVDKFWMIASIIVNGNKQLNNTIEKQEKVICVCNSTEKNVTTNVNLFNNYTCPAVEATKNHELSLLTIDVIILVCVIGLCVIEGYRVLKTKTQPRQEEEEDNYEIELKRSEPSRLTNRDEE